MSGSRVGSSSSTSSKRTVKSAEQADRTRRLSAHSRQLPEQQCADVQVNNMSSHHGSEAADEHSSYYAQCVAPILNQMTGYVQGESSRGMTSVQYE